jgi:branched-chain amino acid transport system permease protein
VTVAAGSAGAPGRASWARAAWWALALVVFALVPWVLTNATVTSIAVFSLGYMAVATAWNFFAYSGYISLGHGVFYGCGAYALTMIALDTHAKGGYGMFWLVPAGGVVAAMVAVPFGFIALRMRRLTFIVVTLAIFWVFQLMAYNLSFTGGSSGLEPPSPPWTGSTYNIPFYYVSLALVVFAVVLSAAIRRSRFGLQLLAIHGDEDRALGLGVKTGRVKLIAFVLSAFVTGMAGALWAYFVGQIFPEFAFYPVFDISVVLMVFFGGVGTLVGPLLGALILESLEQYLTLSYSISSLYLVIYGVLFLLVLLFMPRGIVPGARRFVRDRRLRRQQRRSAGMQLESAAAPGGQVPASPGRGGT